MSASTVVCDSPRQAGNVLADCGPAAQTETFVDLLRTPGVRIERIESNGQATAPGTWLQQDWTEWVLVLRGSAGLRFEDEAETRCLLSGDWVTISPRARHRVEWTQPGEPTVWLAVHAGEATPAD